MSRHTPWWRTISFLALTALVACNSGSSKKSEPPPPPPIEPTFTFTAVGGAGTEGTGGNGGYLDVESYAAGDAQVLRSGTVNTEVTLPTGLPYLGTNWVDVTADTTLEIGTTGFRLTEASTTVENDDGMVTGIWVRPNATLTIKPNFSTYSGGILRDTVEFYLDDGLIVEGTIKIAKIDATDAGDGLGTATAHFWPYYVGGLYVAASGLIDLSGDDSTTGAGGSGGYFLSYPDVLNNAGTIDSSGGSGSTDGGDAGGVQIYTDSGFAINAGSLLADGGAGGTGSGGDAASIYLETSSGYGYVISTGTLSATGGNGATGGGDGAYTYLYTDYGTMLLSGTIRTFGGNATDDGQGGEGGDLDVEPYGSLRVAGTIDTHGGNGAGAGDGGEGGYVDIDLEPNESTGVWEYEADSQSIAFGANVNTNGGSGADGGNAGYFYLGNCNDSTSTPKGSLLAMVGYPKIDLSGGAGTLDGGHAGSWSAYNGYPDDWGYGANFLAAWGDYDGYEGYFAGSVLNEADFVLRGGDGETGAGGGGSGIMMETEYGVYAPYDFGTKNTGALDGSGGAGATNGGSAGDFYLYGKFSLENQGAITASGGAGGTDAGGDAGLIELYSEGPITSAGALTTSGGASDSGDGARGGDVYLETSNVCTVTGGITSSGGSSTSAAAGNGGYVWILSQTAPSSVSGTMTVAAGTGETGTPTAGEVWVDGMQIAGP